MVRTGLGMANAAGAIFGACPVSGSFSRSAVSSDSGARTGDPARSHYETCSTIACALLLV